MLDASNTYRYLDKCSGAFYNPKKVISYNRPWNFLTGSRSIGKSTGLAIFCIIDFIVNKHHFCYTRRTDDETTLTCADYFDNAIQIINNKTDIEIEHFKYDGGKYFIKLKCNDEFEECGRVIPLSLEHKFKSKNLSAICNLIWDEFIPNDENNYLGTRKQPDKEYIKLLSLYQTIDRGIDKPFRNETRFFMLGNTATIYNPIFIKLGICDHIQENSKYIRPKGKLWLLERTDEVEATKLIKESFAYQLSDEDNKNYAYKNVGYDKQHFIYNPRVYDYKATIRLNNNEYGFAVSENLFCIVKPKSHYPVISLDVKGHTGDDFMLITSWRESPTMQRITEAYKKGRLRFYSGKAQSQFLKYLDFT